MEDFLKFLLIAGVILVGIFKEVSKNNKSKKAQNKRPVPPAPSPVEVDPDAIPIPEFWGRGSRALDELLQPIPMEQPAPKPTPKKKKKEEEAQKPSIVAAAGPLVIGQGGKVTTAEADQSTTPAATLTPATPVGKASADMPGYTEIDLKQIPGDVYALMGNGKLVISIGKDEFNMTNMTANAGGALGYQNGKAVAYCTLSADQPYEAIEKAETYTLKLYAPNQTTPSAVIECKKLPSQTTPHAGQPRTYVGEIVKLLMKK